VTMSFGERGVLSQNFANTFHRMGILFILV
jgi:hypothetical protein